jgi:hypothetical protein
VLLIGGIPMAMPAVLSIRLLSDAQQLTKHKALGAHPFTSPFLSSSY